MEARHCIYLSVLTLNHFFSFPNRPLKTSAYRWWYAVGRSTTRNRRATSSGWSMSFRAGALSRYWTAMKRRGKIRRCSPTMRCTTGGKILSLLNFIMLHYTTHDFNTVLFEIISHHGKCMGFINFTFNNYSKTTNIFPLILFLFNSFIFCFIVLILRGV